MYAEKNKVQTHLAAYLLSGMLQTKTGRSHQAIRNPSLLPALRGHLQTLLPYFLRRISLPPGEKMEINLRDGDFVDAVFRKGGGKGLVIISHGLEGSSNSSYVLALSRRYLAMGWDVLAWNFRACSGRLNRLPRLYHSGATEDLEDVIDFSHQMRKPERIRLAGFSLGGNLTLLCLGKKSAWLRERGVESALAISPPLNLAASSAKLNRWWNRLYELRFLRDLKRKISMKEGQFPGRYPLPQIMTSGSLGEFDHRCTAPLHGFDGAEDYYRRCSCLYELRNIEIPVLLLIARNDPMLARGNYAEVMKINPKIRFMLTDEGGHCGFGGSGLL
jgi:predicted alpha/beta-fold hydrolase